MSALNDFVVAAGSYFGLPEGRLVEGSTVDVAGGDMELVLRIVLTTDDLVGIGQRVKAMAELEKADEVKRDVVGESPSRERMRAQYNSMPAEQRSKFGSFAKFVQACGQTGPYTQVKDEPVIPPHVWVPADQLTAQQKMMSVGVSEDGSKYAMDLNDLTKEQMEDYGPRGGDNG